MRAGAYIFAPKGPRLDSDEKRFFAEAQPWGFILFARNVEHPDQLLGLTSDLRGAVGRDAPVFIDQEGGRVARMGAPHWRKWEPPLDFCERLGADAGRAMELRYRIIAAELRAVGIDGNCAPVLDIARTETHPVLKNRCYGMNAGDVVERGAKVAQGLRKGGVIPVMKHIPGHGRAVLDSHLALPEVAEILEELEATDFAPFRVLAPDMDVGMTAHLVFRCLSDLPATLDATMVRLIRERIGFRGLLLTDDISMGALPGPVGERAQRARTAGCDVVLHCNGDLSEMQAVAKVGAMSEVAAVSAERALFVRDNAPDFVDITALSEEFDATFRGRD